MTLLGGMSGAGAVDPALMPTIKMSAAANPNAAGASGRSSSSGNGNGSGGGNSGVSRSASDQTQLKNATAAAYQNRGGCCFGLVSCLRDGRQTFTYVHVVLDEWTVQDVVCWLEDQNLGQYSGGFVSNEITGPVLLDLSLEDLDYMGMTALGHRKIILRSIEDLRANNRITKPLLKASNANTTASPQKVLPSNVSMSFPAG
jgi:hypothetical protein